MPEICACTWDFSQPYFSEAAAMRIKIYDRWGMFVGSAENWTAVQSLAGSYWGCCFARVEIVDGIDDGGPIEWLFADGKWVGSVRRPASVLVIVETAAAPVVAAE